MLSFQVETLTPELSSQIAIMGHSLWEEVALDKTTFVWHPNEEFYANLEAKKLLFVMTARDEGMLVGYYVGNIIPHIHYKDAGLVFITDMYYLLPAYRKGLAGLKMFTALEKFCKDLNVVKLYSSHKVMHDRGHVFKTLGWTPHDIVYTKVIGDKNE